MKTTINITYPAFALFAFACFTLSPQARAVCRNDCDLANDNTFQGQDALLNNTTGTLNTAIGSQALLNNTEGVSNTATGKGALSANTTGSSNTATGVNALFVNTTGRFNTAAGIDALEFNQTGNFNTASGEEALRLNSTGSYNTAIGGVALRNNDTGESNVAVGYRALYSNSGGSNIAVGRQAGENLTTGSNNIDIGAAGVAGESGAIRIGKVQTTTFIAGIYGVMVPPGIGVIVGPNGKLGTNISSARFKEAIQPMDKASEAIHALKPVSFRYKHELDPAGTPQFGLVAEEVAKVNPDLVARDEQGKPYTVRYEAVNAMLLNEFLKEHKAFVEEQRRVQEQGTTIGRLQKQVETLATGLQKVSAQLELSKSAPRTVLNNQ